MAALACAAVAACAGGAASAGGGASEPIPQSSIAPEMGVNLADYTRTPEGVYYRDMTVGTGAEATAKSRVTVAYRGLLANGTQVDSSAGFSFRMSGGQVIRGWQIGVAGMRVGGARILIIPPHLGYGWKEVGPIPRNSTLLFRVQLMEVR